MNKKAYQILFTLLILTSILGSSIPVFKLFGFNFYAFRIILLAVSGFFFYKQLTSKEKPELHGVYKLFAFVILGFIIIGGVSIYKVVNKTLYLKEVVYWLIALVTILVVVQIRKMLIKHEIKSLIFNVLQTIFILLVGFAIFEYTTGTHFQVNAPAIHELLLRDPDTIIKDPYFTFGNPNNLAFVVVFICSIMLTFYREKKPELLLFYVASTFFIAGMTSSRLALICSLILLPLCLYNLRGWLKDARIVVITSLSAVVLAIILTGFGKPVLTDKSKDLLIEDGGLIGVIDSADIEELQEELTVLSDSSSNSIRRNLIKNCFEAGASNYYTGLGAGQFNWYLSSDESKYDVHGVYNAHGLMIMVYANYGILGILLILILVVFWMRFIWVNYKNSADRIAHFIFIVVLLINSFGPSSFVQQPYIWTLLGIYVLLFVLETDDKEESVSKTLE